jgi:mercuric ion transport protein
MSQILDAPVREPGRQARGARQILLSLGALFSALGVFTSWLCCLLPFTLGAAGIGASALGSRLQPYRPLFTGLTVVLLAGAFYQAYRPRSEACAADAVCARPRGRRAQRIAVWTAAWLAILLMTAPYWVSLYARWAG